MREKCHRNSSVLPAVQDRHRSVVFNSGAYLLHNHRKVGKRDLSSWRKFAGGSGCVVAVGDGIRAAHRQTSSLHGWRQGQGTFSHCYDCKHRLNISGIFPPGDNIRRILSRALSKISRNPKPRFAIGFFTTFILFSCNVMQLVRNIFWTLHNSCSCVRRDSCLCASGCVCGCRWCILRCTCFHRLVFPVSSSWFAFADFLYSGPLLGKLWGRSPSGVRRSPRLVLLHFGGGMFDESSSPLNSTIHILSESNI